jgi:hypothetical protein
VTDNCNPALLRGLVDRLNRRMERQKAFSFLTGMNEGALRIGQERGLRFGSGPGLDGAPLLTGMEEVPDFPLTRNGTLHYV